MARFGLFQIQLQSKLKNILPVFLGLIFIVSQIGCTIWHIDPFVNREVKIIPDELMHYYDYPKHSVQAARLKEDAEKNYIYRKVEFPLYLPEELQTKSRGIEIKVVNSADAFPFRGHLNLLSQEVLSLCLSFPDHWHKYREPA